MQDINLPRHVVAALEKKRAARFQQQAAAGRTGKLPARRRTDARVVTEHRAPRPATGSPSAL